MSDRALQSKTLPLHVAVSPSKSPNITHLTFHGDIHGTWWKEVFDTSLVLWLPRFPAMQLSEIHLEIATQGQFSVVSACNFKVKHILWPWKFFCFFLQPNHLLSLMFRDGITSSYDPNQKRKKSSSVLQWRRNKKRLILPLARSRGGIVSFESSPGPSCRGSTY